MICLVCARASTLLKRWCPESDLNQRPTAYEAVALPLSYRGVPPLARAGLLSRLSGPRQGARQVSPRLIGHGGGRSREHQWRRCRLDRARAFGRSVLRNAPGERVEGEALPADWLPCGARRVAAVADIARVGRCGRGAFEPLARRFRVTRFAVFEPRHHQAEPPAWSARRRGGDRHSEMTARFPPQPRIQRRLGDREMALQGGGVL
jgi:hypothetical protein